MISENITNKQNKKNMKNNKYCAMWHYLLVWIVNKVKINHFEVVVAKTQF